MMDRKVQITNGFIFYLYIQEVTEDIQQKWWQFDLH